MRYNPFILLREFEGYISFPTHCSLLYYTFVNCKNKKSEINHSECFDNSSADIFTLKYAGIFIF